MPTLTISLPDSLREFIEHEVASKGYGNVSEYVRGLVREAQAKDSDARLEALLIQGLTTGESQPASPEFWAELRADAARILSRRSQPGKAQSKS